ncbi:hypothetical protein ABZ356_02755 [Micromonospora zamorensis]|uniref:hypothetical protein n=1 Tax=Micromonospora zamorensis TaxID=709883 RepID=UPI0033CC1D27
MRPRKVDLAFDWMRSRLRRAFHYRDEVWAALAELHPDEVTVSDDRKTPWFSLHRDMTQDARFLRGDKVMFELDGAGRGPLWRHVRSMLEQVSYRPGGASTQDSLWASAVHVLLKNLGLLDVFERDGDVLRLTDNYQSKIKAHPGDLQDRGEKPHRVRLSQFLAALHGGQA